MTVICGCTPLSGTSKEKKLGKLFQELKHEIKEDLRGEMKTLRVALEREIRNDVREMGVELREVKNGMDFMNGVLKDVKVKLESVLKENAELKRENG